MFEIFHPADPEPLEYKIINFPSGERGVSFDYVLESLSTQNSEYIRVYAEIVTADDIMELMQVLDVLVNSYGNQIVLTIPYIPYGRQDRRTNGEKEPFALKVFADMLNSFNLKAVITFSQHSNVTELLINNLKNVEPYKYHSYRSSLLSDVDGTMLMKKTNDDVIVIAPDNGAEKRAYQFAEFFNIKDVFVCSKRRDATNGKIIGMVGPEIPKDKRIIVVDDICDGGRTFVEVAKILPKERKSLTLYVTHGIFSHESGRQVLYDAGYDTVACAFDFIEKRNKKC